jgi:hypothetical protein
MSGKKADNYPRLPPVKDSSLFLAAGLGPEINFRTCLEKTLPYLHVLVNLRNFLYPQTEGQSFQFIIRSYNALLRVLLDVFVAM